MLTLNSLTLASYFASSYSNDASSEAKVASNAQSVMVIRKSLNATDYSNVLLILLVLQYEINWHKSQLKDVVNAFTKIFNSNI
ncbi:MAG: Hypothetical protein AJITA_00081 [Acetilactobacillus jinshanensis]